MVIALERMVIRLTFVIIALFCCIENARAQANEERNYTTARLQRLLSATFGRLDQSEYTWIIWTYESLSLDDCTLTWRETEDTNLKDTRKRGDGVDAEYIRRRTFTLPLKDVDFVGSGPAFRNVPEEDGAQVAVRTRLESITRVEHTDKQYQYHSGRTRNEETNDPKRLVSSSWIHVGASKQWSASNAAQDAADLAKLFKAVAEYCGARNVILSVK